jgi:hypothetical protein
VLYFLNSPEEVRKQDFRNRQILEDTLNNVRNANRVDVQVEFLKRMILRLDKKQVAESIAKIVNCEKQRGGTCHLTQSINLRWSLSRP